MPKFLTQNIDPSHAVITGDDVRHITRVLRMKEGDKLIICDEMGHDFDCEIEKITKESVICSVIAPRPGSSESSCRVHIFMAVPKQDKMATVVQKSVELGAVAITPVLTYRCVSRPEGKGAHNKIERWQKIAIEAAKQSGRSILPTVTPIMNLGEALEKMKEYQTGVVLYEKGGQPLGEFINPNTESVAVLIGSVGGFEEEEIQRCQKAGVQVISLGRRILRCETAPLAALAVIQYLSGNLS